MVYYDQGKTETDLGPFFFDPTRPDPLSKQPNAIQSIDGPDPCPSLGGGGVKARYGQGGESMLNGRISELADPEYHFSC